MTDRTQAIETAAIMADLEDLRIENVSLKAALENARASLVSTMTEARASVTFEAITAKGWTPRFTLRDDDEAILLERFAALFGRLDKLKATPWPPVQQQAEAAPAPAQLSPLPGLPTPQAAPAPANGSGVQTIHAVKMEVTPLADGKAKLAFYEAGHKFPDISSTQSIDRLLALLAPTGGWTAAHLATAQPFNVSLDIDWKPSEKLNNSGKPYKDVVAIRPR